MTIHAFEIPDDQAQLPGWLEQRLVSLDLAALVAELTGVHGTSSKSGPSLNAILGDQLNIVLEKGLANIPRATIGYLMMRPHLLLELQELIFVSGGVYWDQVSQPSAELEQRISRGRSRLDQFLPVQSRGLKPTQSATLVEHDEPAQSNRPQKPTHRSTLPQRGHFSTWYRHPAVVSFATAAAVLFGVFMYEQNLKAPSIPTQVVAQTAWGWNKPGALTQQVPADAYLTSLADAASEWFNQQPDESTALARRIGEFRQGCSVLLLADHKLLSDEDRQWLLERCRAWATKLNGHLAAIESGEEVVKVRAEADETINKLVGALRARAKGLATG